MKKIAYFASAVLALLAGLMNTGCQVKAVTAPETESVAATVTSEDGWYVDFKAARAKAKAESKYLLVDFSGSDWCGWCIKLDKDVFSQPAFKAFAETSLVPVLLDFPQSKPQPDAIKKQNELLMKAYGIEGFPTILVLDPDGNLVDQTGYREGGAASYIEHLQGIIDRHKNEALKK